MMRQAAQTGLRRLFDPRSVAVYGASSDPRKIGGRPVDFLKRNFAGALYPINPTHSEVQGLRAYSSAQAIDGPVDMAIVAVPAARVLDALEDCAKNGVGAAVVLSSGFAEAGGDGVEQQRRITELARRSGMRVLGPNCMGVINTRKNLLGTFAPTAGEPGLKHGRISLVSQSGAFAGYCLSMIRQRGMGLNLWATTGNQSDVDVADCVRFYAEDEDTDVIIGFIEGIEDQDRLIDALTVARDRDKHVIVVKVGSSEVGAKASAAHTGSVVGSDPAYDALFRQYGAHRVRSLQELFDVSYALLVCGRLPSGAGLGLLTVSGGVGAMMADAAEGCGLDVAPMPEDAQRRLKEMIPFAGPRNPVDITGQLINDMTLFEKNLHMMLDEGGYDQVITFFSSVGQSTDLGLQLLEQLLVVRERFPDRIIIVSMLANPEVRKQFEEAGVVVFEDPTRAVEAAGALARLGQERARAVASDA